MKSEKCGKLTPCVADKTEYYLVGSGAGDLKASGWDILNVAGRLILAPQKTAAGRMHTITVRLHADDRFQICHDGDWSGQIGIGHMEGARLCEDGVARVENEKGETVFWGHGPESRPMTAWDCRLCSGMDGVYELTFLPHLTDPRKSRLSFRLVEQLPPLQAPHQMMVVGSFNGWNVEDDDDRYQMVAVGEDRVLLLGVDAPGECKIYDRSCSMWIGVQGQNISLDAPGVYAIAYSQATESVCVERCRLSVEGHLPRAARFEVTQWSEPRVTLDGRCLPVCQPKDIIPCVMTLEEDLPVGMLRIRAISRFGSRIWEMTV